MEAMRRPSVILLMTLVTLLLAAPAQAITYGQPDGTQHPNVGEVASSEGLCSGTLIASTVFLTAAHCGVDGQPVQVTFDTIATNFPLPDAPACIISPSCYTGTFYADPEFADRQNDPHDIAVVVLDTAPGITPAQLPGAGQFDTLKKEQKDQQFTAVGYGVTERVHTPGEGAPEFPDNSTRMFAVSTLNTVNPAWLRLSMNPAHDDGGGCYGDSGGPNFLWVDGQETQIIAGTTITGDAVCRATNVIYRLDTPSARSFLAQYVTVPERGVSRERDGHHRQREGRRSR